jgi:hypothetical protein
MPCRSLTTGDSKLVPFDGGIALLTPSRGPPSGGELDERKCIGSVAEYRLCGDTPLQLWQFELVNNPSLIYLFTPQNPNHPSCFLSTPLDTGSNGQL